MASFAGAKRHSSPNINPNMSLRRPKPRIATEDDRMRLDDIVRRVEIAKKCERGEDLKFAYNLSEIVRIAKRILTPHL